MGDSGRRGCEGVHIQKRKHFPQYRQRLSQPDFHRVDSAGIASLEIRGAIRHRRKTRQNQWANRDVQRKAGNPDQCRLSDRGGVNCFRTQTLSRAKTLRLKLTITR